MMTIRDYKLRSIKLMSKCWVESAFVLAVNISIPFIAYLIIILIASLAGIHDPSDLMPVFTELPLWFILTSAAICIFTYVISAPIYFGTRWFFWHAAKGECMPVSSLFASYSSKISFRKALNIRLYIGFRKLAYLIPCAAAVFLESDISRRLRSYYSGETYEVLFTVGMVIFIVCIAIIYFMLSMKYIPVGFLIIEDPDSDLYAILNRTRSTIIRNRRRIFTLFASFAGWILSCLLFFPILFVYPYILMTTALFIGNEFEGKNTDRAKGDHIRSFAEKSLQNV